MARWLSWFERIAGRGKTPSKCSSAARDVTRDASANPSAIELAVAPATDRCTTRSRAEARALISLAVKKAGRTSRKPLPRAGGRGLP
jgi:hypothetical protein